MLNILKMDLHRFLTNKVLYLMLLIYTAFQIFGIFMMKQYPVEYDGVPVSSLNASEFIQVGLAQTPSWVLLYVTVFAVYFYMSELNSGFYKNYVSMEGARIHSVLSKVFILGLFTLFIMLTMVISDFIGRNIFFGHASLGDVGYFMKVFFGQFALHWAFSVVVLLLTMLTKNAIVSLGIGVAIALNVPGMVIETFDTLIDGINVSQFMLINTVKTVRDFHDISEVIHVASVAIIYLVLFSFIAVRYKVKEDLR